MVELDCAMKHLHENGWIGALVNSGPGLFQGVKDANYHDMLFATDLTVNLMLLLHNLFQMAEAEPRCEMNVDLDDQVIALRRQDVEVMQTALDVHQRERIQAVGQAKILQHSVPSDSGRTKMTGYQ